MLRYRYGVMNDVVFVVIIRMGARALTLDRPLPLQLRRRVRDTP